MAKLMSVFGIRTCYNPQPNFWGFFIMPRISIRAIYSFFSGPEIEKLAKTDLVAIRDLIDKRLGYLDSQANELETILDQANELASRLGFNTIEDLIAERKKTTAAPAPRKLKQPQSRKCYMNPLDPNSDAYAIFAGRTQPAWFSELLAQGWDRDELKYANHAAAMQRRGLTPLYDAPARHAELMAHKKQNPHLG